MHRTQHEGNKALGPDDITAEQVNDLGVANQNALLDMASRWCAVCDIGEELELASIASPANKGNTATTSNCIPITLISVIHTSYVSCVMH